MSAKVTQNGGDEDSFPIGPASINAPELWSLCAANERKHLVKEIAFNYQLWKWEQERNSVPAEHFHTWKGIVGQSPDFSWTIEGIPTNPWEKWPLFQKFVPTLKCSIIIEQLKKKPHQVGVELLYNEYVKWSPKPTLFVVLRAISGGGSKDSVATKLFVYGEMSKKEFESHFICVTFPKTQLVHPGYNSNNSVTFDFYLEKEWSTQFVQSCGGDLFWTIDNFPNLIRTLEDPNMQLFSPYFYTSPGPHGYRIQAIMSRQGSFLYVRIVFLTGKFDDKGQKKPKIYYDYKITLTTPDCLTWIGQYANVNIRALKFCQHLGDPEAIAVHKTICLKLDVIMK